MTRSIAVWLVISPSRKNVWDLNVRLAKREPRLEPGEIATKLNISAPKSLFENPVIQLNLNLPDSVQRDEIDVGVVEDELRQCTGLEVSIVQEQETSS